MPYTSQTKVDAEIIESVLAEAAKNQDSLKVLEVGTFFGETSREIKRWCDERGKKLEFWGIDAGWHPNFNQQEPIKPPLPFDGANMVYGDSAEVFHLIPFGLDVALIDGCHCVNHAILDTIHYGLRVKVGGFLMFHDTSPFVQQTMRDPHGPNIPEFHNSVNLAHCLMRFPNDSWNLFKQGFEEGAPWGGINVFQKKS